MKKTIWIICLTAACLLLGLVVYISLSGKNENGEQKYSFYYINSDETKLKEETYMPEKETAEVMIQDFSERLNNRETREGGTSIFPDGVKISSCTVDDGVLILEFNEAYNKMSRTRELLVRAGVVKTFIQVPGVDYVEIYVGKKPLTDTKGDEVGAGKLYKGIAVHSSDFITFFICERFFPHIDLYVINSWDWWYI